MCQWPQACRQSHLHPLQQEAEEIAPCVINRYQSQENRRTRKEGTSRFCWNLQVASKLLPGFQVLPTEVSKRTVELYILAMRAMTINYQGGVRDWRVCGLLKRAMRII